MSETVNRHGKVTTMLEKLGRDVEELRDSDAWKAMLRVQGRFTRYSASNQLMIWMQMPEATRVAGFRQWLQLERQVQKGERSIKIFAPMTKKDKEDNTTKLIGFKLVSVFDISQTEGEPLPEVPWPMAEHAPADLLPTLVQKIESLGMVVDLNPVHRINGARGWYNPQDCIISVVPSTEAAMCATLLHEAGHALDPQLEADDDRGRRELVAESVSYVLGLRFGIDCVDEVTHYLASWKGGVEALLAISERVKLAVGAFDAAPAPVLVPA